MTSRVSSGVALSENPFLAPTATEHYHELRVRIPTDVHRQLLALKILRGVTLAETVVIALDRYFAQRGIAPEEQLAPAAKIP